MLLLKVTKVTTGHQRWPKIGQNSIIRSFLPEGQKKPRPKPSAGARSRPAYRAVSSSLLNNTKHQTAHTSHHNHPISSLAGSLECDPGAESEEEEEGGGGGRQAEEGCSQGDYLPCHICA